MNKFINISLFTTLLLFSAVKFSYAQTPNWMWTKSCGSTYLDISNSIKSDNSSNVYIIGQGANPMNFDSLIVGIHNTFISKYSSSGQIQWVLSINNDSIGFGGDLEVYNQNLFVSGGYNSTDTLFYIGDTLIGKGICLFKYDLDSNLLWTKGAGVANYIDGYGRTMIDKLSCDKNENIFLLGSFSGISDTTYLTIGNTVIKSRGQFNDIFIAKYDSSGNPLWAKNGWSSRDDYGKSIAVDSKGNVYVTGYFEGAIFIIGSDTLTNGIGTCCEDELFIIKFDPYGNINWIKTADGQGSARGNSIAIDSEDNIYVSGEFGINSINIGGTLLDTINGWSFITKIDTSGNVIWAKNYQGNNKLITSDFQNNLFIAGTFSDTITIGNIVLATSYGIEIFFAKIDSAGVPVWAKSALGGFGVSGICSDSTGNAYITGDFRGGYIIFGLDTLYNLSIPPWMGWGDIYIAKIEGSVSSVNEVQNQNSIVVYPNPVSEYLNINFQNNTSEQTKFIIEITDVSGRIIQCTTVSNNEPLDISSLPSGIYIIKGYHDKDVAIGKFIKQ